MSTTVAKTRLHINIAKRARRSYYCSMSRYHIYSDANIITFKNITILPCVALSPQGTPIDPAPESFTNPPDYQDSSLNSRSR